MPIIKKLIQKIKGEEGLANDEILVITDMEEQKQRREAEKETKEDQGINPRELYDF